MKDSAGVLTDKFDRALLYATHVHGGQVRKSTTIPYVAHLLAVSATVLEYGGDEAQAIAGLLHDAIEDQADAFGSPVLLCDIIAGKFGPTVLRLVELCSDCAGKPKPAWAWRKQQHLARLARASAYECLVPACDKLHNLRCLNSELRHGDAAFGRLKAGPQEQLQHLAAVVRLFEDKGLPLAGDLKHELAQLRQQIPQPHFMLQPTQARAACAMS